MGGHDDTHEDPGTEGVVDPRRRAFLEWREENPLATISIPAFGSEWEFPRDQPVELVMWMAEQRARGRGIDQVTEAQFIDELIPIIVPPDVLAEWKRLPITDRELYEAVGRVFARYRGLLGGDASGEGQAEEATTSSTKSSSSGRSSKRTSSASTGSRTSRRK